MKNLPKTLSIPLIKALSLKRAAGSTTEAEFRAWLCREYSRHLSMVDEAGNLHFVIGESHTIFAAHCDTCHDGGGVNSYTVSKGMVYAKDECLGADDGAGVAILCHMMSNNIPGRFIFTTGEEIGGVGARHIADTYPEMLAKYDRSICFDRAGTSEIITVQGGQRCASTEMAEELAWKLADLDLLYAESTHGTFTDNKLWRDYVPCNVNLGVGYEYQHGSKEQLDLKHLALLAKAVVKIDWENLPTYRDTKEVVTYGSVFGLFGKNTHDLLSEFERGDKKGLETLLLEEGGSWTDSRHITPEVIDEAFRHDPDQALYYLLDVCANVPTNH